MRFGLGAGAGGCREAPAAQKPAVLGAQGERVAGHTHRVASAEAGRVRVERVAAVDSFGLGVEDRCRRGAAGEVRLADHQDADLVRRALALAVGLLVVAVGAADIGFRSRADAIAPALALVRDLGRRVPRFCAPFAVLILDDLLLDLLDLVVREDGRKRHATSPG